MTATGLRRVLAATLASVAIGAAAQIHLVSDNVRRDALAEASHIERALMVPMRDGVRLATRVYLPKDAEGPVPAILWRSPYNLSEKKEPNPDYSDANLKFALDAVERGYAFVMQNERGKFFSEGDWEILGRPRTDGHDTLTWIAEQDWSNGKVGTIGCSSTAEWIMGLGSKPHPAHAAAVPMGMGAGIGRMGPHYEQGNFYRGGVVQLPMMAWLYGEQNLLRPQFTSDLSREERQRAERYYDLVPDMPSPDWGKAARHLPLADVITAAGGPPGVFDEMVRRGPDHKDWYKGGLYHDNEDFTVPALWVNSWYDLSVAPNLALYNHVRENASAEEVRNAQYMIVAPTEHCHMYRLRQPHVVGDRDMGIVDFGLDEIVYDFFDHYMKGEDNGFARGEQPRVRYFAMGANRWQASDTWPPANAETQTLYLASGGSANSLAGDGTLVATPPDSSAADRFRYDPLNPVPSLGGNVCCLGDTVEPGSFDQRPVEARQDVLVYTSEPLPADLEVSGPVEVILYVSSDARDTDFTAKLVDVAPDGTAWNLDETIQRARYREGYDREVFLEENEVVELRLGPLATSNVFKAGHRIRLEVSSSSFPRFARNLNTGGDNATATEPVVAVNAVHHGEDYPSRIVLTTVPVAYAPHRDYYSFAEPDRFVTRHLALDLTVDFDQRALEGSATLHMRRLDPQARQVILDTRDITVTGASVAMTDGAEKQPAEYRLGEAHDLLGRALVIDLPAGFQPDGEFQLQIDYRTSPEASALQWLPANLTAGGDQPMMFSQSQAIHARSWVPLQDTPAVRITYEATIRTPDNMLAVMSADNDPDTARDGEYHFEMPQPIPSYLLAIAAGNLAFEPLGEDTGVYAEPELLSASAFEFANTQDMLDTAETLFGPYDWGRYDLLILPPAFPYGGMENPRLSFITSSVLAGDRSLVSLIAHELAHSWSGNLVTNRTWRDIWLNEGTTSYLEARLMESLYGTDRADEERVLGWNSLQDDLEQVPARFQALAPKVLPEDGESPQQGMQYQKGQFFLEHLERLFGRERFDPFMNSYFEAFAWQSITTEDFLDYLDDKLLSVYPGIYTREQAGEWLYEPGIPDDFEPPMSANLQVAADAARAFATEDAALTAWDTASWSPQATVQFIEALPDAISAGQLATADAHFGFSESGNVAITRAWFTLVAGQRYEAAYPQLKQHLRRFGRMYLVVPVYRALAGNGHDAPLAKALFAEYRDRYHPITQNAVASAIGIDS